MVYEPQINVVRFIIAQGTLSEHKNTAYAIVWYSKKESYENVYDKKNVYFLCVFLMFLKNLYFVYCTIKYK